MLIVPERLAAACRETPERHTWLERLPHAIRELQDRWSLSLRDPFDGSDVSCAWVAPAVRADGTRVVLKLGMPHMEAAGELEGLRFWDGDPTVRLLESDAGLNAMLLEACEPGTPLRDLPEPEQDVVVAGLLRRASRHVDRQNPRPGEGAGMNSGAISSCSRRKQKLSPLDAILSNPIGQRFL